MSDDTRQSAGIVPTGSGRGARSVAKGGYLFHIHVRRRIDVRVGMPGDFEFQPSHYLYVGSGLGSLWPRIARHFAEAKRRRWHIEFLTTVPRPDAAWVALTDDRVRRFLPEGVSALPGAKVRRPRLRVVGLHVCRRPAQDPGTTGFNKPRAHFAADGSAPVADPKERSL